MNKRATLLDKAGAREILRQLGDALRVVDYSDQNVYMYVVQTDGDNRYTMPRVHNSASGAIGDILEALDTSQALDYDVSIHYDGETANIAILAVWPRKVITATIRRALKMYIGV